MIQTKDLAGNTVNVASRGVANAGLTTGIIGTVLGVMNNGGLGNILGGNNNECTVSMTKYYEDRIQDIKDQNAQFTAVYGEICGLKERASVSETTNYFQNEITKAAFNTQSTLTDYKIEAGLCGCVKGVPMIRPEQIGDPYHGVRLGLGYAEAPIGFGACDPCGYRG